MHLLLDKNHKPIYCKHCGSINISIDDHVCYSCGADDILNNSYAIES